ncbi:OmpA family protein [Massilia sp. S19_KUP03_FR1]|uniref:OmpA family protein n=1 Tax=Massilia sp. S19_KUP03_FR1 TaxID=3025503 RepID=UPI002FCDC6C5
MASQPGRTGGAHQAAIDPCLDESPQNAGAVLGALAGGFVAKKVSNGKYAVPFGALLGGAIGHAIGKDVSRRRCELATIAKKHDLEMRTVVLQLPKAGQQNGANENAVGMSASVVDKGGAAGQFMPNSDVLTPTARGYFADIAATYTPRARSQGMDAQEAGSLQSSKVLIVGHTDDHEDTRAAADLSERRARAVANVFRDAGVPESSLYFQGAGETLPVADNNSAAGRASNRRVEIVDVANDSVMSSYLASRVSVSSYFQPVTEVTAATPDKDGVRPGTGSAGASKKVASAAPARSNAGVKPLPKVASSAPAPARAAAPAPKAPADTPARVLAGAAAPLPAPANGLDLGGVKFDTRRHQVNVGQVLRNDGFSLLPLAIADEMPMRSCVDDRARVSHSVKSLRGGAEYKTGDYQPGAYGTSWVGTVNGNLVSMNNVAVIRAGGLPASNPTVLIFKDFSEKGGVTRKPDFTIVPVVNTYTGSRGTLYRVFFEQGAPLRCIDVVLPAAGPFKAEQGYVYQSRNAQLFASEFKPEVPRSR